MKQLNLNSLRLRNLNHRQKKSYLKFKKRIYKLPPFDSERYNNIVDITFENNDFIRQVEEVKHKLPFDGELIEDVIKFHIRKMSEELTKVRPWKRRIYIHSWGYIEVFPYVFNPYSLYYDHQKTMKFIKKYQKEFNILKTKNNE